MAFDSEELATLTYHGTMKLRPAVSRAMTRPPKKPGKRPSFQRSGTNDSCPSTGFYAGSFGSGRVPHSRPEAGPRHPH
jgi:hypothetical protein